MAIELPALPYAQDALEPHISANTLSFHHGKHHNAYVTKCNELTAGTDLPIRRAIRVCSIRRPRFGTTPSIGIP